MSVPFWVKALTVVLALCGTALAIPLALGGAAVIDGVTADRSSTQTATLEPGGSVSIKVASAHIVIVPGADGQVAVDEHDTARALTRRLAQIELDGLRTTVLPSGKGVIVVTDTRNPFGSFGTTRDRRLTIHVPATAALSVIAASADIQVSGVSGDVSIETASGSVSMRDMDVTGRLDARVVSGNLEYDGTVHGGNLQLSAVSGSVRAYIPKTTDVHFEASTVSGAIIIDRGFPIPVLGQGRAAQSAKGDIGTGGPAVLTMNTVSGAVYLRIR